MMVIVGLMAGSGMACAQVTPVGVQSGTPVGVSGGTPIGVSSGSTTTTPSAYGNTSTKLENPLKAESIRDVIFLIVDLAIWLGTAFAILAIIFVGFKFIYAQGKPEEIKEAKMWFMYIIIGLAILISSKVIVVIIQNTLTDTGVVNRSVFGN